MNHITWNDPQVLNIWCLYSELHQYIQKAQNSNNILGIWINYKNTFNEQNLTELMANDIGYENAEKTVTMLQASSIILFANNKWKLNPQIIKYIESQNKKQKLHICGIIIILIIMILLILPVLLY